MNNKVEIKKEDISVYAENGTITHAYVRNGGTVWFIRPEERNLAPEQMWNRIRELWKQGNGVWRCSGCGVEMEKGQIAGWPLFAGISCSACWQKHLAHLQDQRNKGHVCRMCGRPYDDCCC